MNLSAHIKEHAVLGVNSTAAVLAAASTISAIDATVFSATIVDAFVYDTAKDSDGGAWRHRCGHTSWQNEALSGNWLGSAANEAAARAISGATTGSYYYDTTSAGFYTLNAGSGKTVTYRGNTAKFPAKVLITVEAARVVLWDLTQAGAPMWMVFVEGVYNAINTNSVALTSASMRNGLLCVGGFRLAEISFIADTMLQVEAPWINRGILIASRNAGVVSSFTAAGSSGIVNNYTNDVAMTVLPSAPVDVATGLPVPTIAVATNGGVSVITDSGSVWDIVESSGPSSTHKVAFTADNRLMFAYSDTGAAPVDYAHVQVCGIPTADVSINYYYARSGVEEYNYAQYPSIADSFADALYAAIQNSRAGLAIGMSDRLAVLWRNPASPTDGMVAYVTKDYNTGWMAGDIQAAICANSGNTITDRSVKAISTASTTLATAAVASGAELLSFTDSGGNITATLGATIASGHHVHWEYVSGAWKQYISAVDGSGNSTANGYVDGVASAAVPITNVAVASGTGVTILQNITVANARFSATAISAEQAAKLYRDELPLFQANAACTLAGSSNAVTALAYDEDTDLLHVGTSYGRSTFKGLERIASEATAVGSITALSAVGGVIAQGGATAVDVYVPAYNLREELNRAAEQKKAFGQALVAHDFTATASQTTFTLPVGWEIVAVYQQGSIKRETTSWTRSFDGFKWSAVLGTGATVSDWISILARRTK